MRTGCHSEPVLATVFSGGGDDGEPALGLERVHSLLCTAREDASDFGDLQTDNDYVGWRARHPCLLTNFSDFQERLWGRRLAVFLDYDGTLTPIVRNPDDAVMSDQMRDAVRQVAGMFPTAIISGRGREKVESFVRLPELYYAGSHGMDIVGPRGAAVGSAGAAGGNGGGHEAEPFTFQAAAEYQPLIDSVYARLRDSLASIPGASVEHNKFCVSAHFRNCHPDSWQRVVSAVDAAVVADGGGRLHVTRGRKVLEVRPTVDWDKGSALLHLLQVLGLAGQPDVVAVYLGDDKTDEDAFAALAGAGAGAGVLVSTVAKPTAAAFTLRDPEEVLQLLQRLLAYGAGDGNGWRKYDGGSCNGWAPSAALVQGGGKQQEQEEEQQQEQEQQQQQREEKQQQGQRGLEHGGGQQAGRNGWTARLQDPASRQQQQQQQQHLHVHHQQLSKGDLQQHREADAALTCDGRCQA